MKAMKKVDNMIIQEGLRKSKRIVNFLLTLSGFIILLLLASRIIILSTFFIAFIYLFFFNYSFSKLLVLLGAVLVFVTIVLTVPTVQSRFIEAVNFSDKVELDAPIEEHRTLGRNFGGRAIRQAIWTCSMDVVKSNWLFGVGAGDVHQHLQKSYKDHNFEFAYKYNNYNAHNLFIETVIAVGMIGLLLVFMILGRLITLAIKQKNLVFFTFSISFTLLSLMESSFNVHRGIVFFALFACLFQNSFRAQSKKKGGLKPPF
jgi:O-antigen ligase